MYLDTVEEGYPGYLVTRRGTLCAQTDKEGHLVCSETYKVGGGGILCVQTLRRRGTLYVQRLTRRGTLFAKRQAKRVTPCVLRN